VYHSSISGKTTSRNGIKNENFVVLIVVDNNMITAVIIRVIIDKTSI
jgi:hypothetical protein